MHWRVRRKGFSLVELLIVVALMVILAGGLALSMRGGVDKAKAARVLSDLSSLKSAVALYQADTLGTADAEKAPTPERLRSYVEGVADGLTVKVWPAGGAVGDKWYVGLSGLSQGGDAAKKLTESAVNSGLLAGEAGEPSGSYAGGSTVWVRAR